MRPTEAHASGQRRAGGLHGGRRTAGEGGRFYTLWALGSGFFFWQLVLFDELRVGSGTWVPGRGLAVAL